MIARLVLTAHELVEALRLRHIQRVQYQGIHYTEDYGVCADGHCQRHDGRHGEAGRLAQHAESEAHIPHQILD